MNRWITNEQAEKQVILYPPSEKTFRPSMRPAHPQSPMWFVHLTAIPWTVRDNCSDENRGPEVDLWAEGIDGVRHHKSVCFTVCRVLFRIVALGMQDCCLSEYEANSSETP